jgi:effector-binding domain-containing protein
MEAKMEIDVGVPVATTVTGDGRVTAEILPAGRYATLIYNGPYGYQLEGGGQRQR